MHTCTCTNAQRLIHILEVWSHDSGDDVVSQARMALRYSLASQYSVVHASQRNTAYHTDTLRSRQDSPLFNIVLLLGTNSQGFNHWLLALLVGLNSELLAVRSSTLQRSKRERVG